jgi:hypothetical protein
MSVFIGPEPINSDHDLSAFCCGVPILDDWLKKRVSVHRSIPLVASPLEETTPSAGSRHPSRGGDF